MIPPKNSQLGRDLSRALAVRRLYFADEIHLSAPTFKHYRNLEVKQSAGPRFKAVSVTGHHCSLGCDHCRGTLLEAMVPTKTPDSLREVGKKLAAQGCTGILVSGGCGPEGRVPLESFLPVVGELKRSYGLSIVVHAGLADEGLATALVDADVDMVTVDVVGDVETAKEVLHLDASPERFQRSLSILIDAGLAVSPHIVAGLSRGELRGERRALEIAAELDISSLVLVVMRPEPKTPFQNITPTAPEKVAELMVEARLTLPQTPLQLGCARPVGYEGRRIEGYALQAGFNGIAFPADVTVRMARALGLKTTFVEQCCALPIGDR